ncbi:MAG: hypothetical protein ETSY1_00405 [Candidatus Entotheonella factor]|uniref:Type II secretion system protein GspF domain-containing protein n=1 Tax=Entotheonella factor TaxID=1429438 RepID=W4M026_ENTF1|nr:MAG: hypothetical protein ETSY1_00405 [Candidatus Entotheonella factor]
MNPILYIVAIPTLVLFIAAIWAVLSRPQESPAQARLQAWLNWEKQQGTSTLPPRQTPRRESLFDAIVSNNFLPELSRMLTQVNSPYNVVTFLLLILLSGVGSGVLTSLFTSDPLQIGIVALACGATPYLVLLYNKQQYLQQMESQLPQALDMLAQSLWAGHTIQTGIRIIGDDFEEPICSEFRRTAESIELGTPLPSALDELALRVDIADLRFFITSVLVQRETGGNLAEIITRTADIIRERLEFKDRIKALSAEGKISAYILLAMPVALAVYFYLTHPKHFEAIFQWQWGAVTLTATAIWMVIGMVVIQWMVKIDV